MCAYGQDVVGRNWHARCPECEPTPPNRPQLHRELAEWEKEELDIDVEATALRCNTCGNVKIVDESSDPDLDVDGPQSQLAARGRAA